MPTTNGGANASVGAVNYATEYTRALSQMFPYVLNFGALYATENNGRYRWVNAKTIMSLNTKHSCHNYGH